MNIFSEHCIYCLPMPYSNQLVHVTILLKQYKRKNTSHYWWQKIQVASVALTPHFFLNHTSRNIWWCDWALKDLNIFRCTGLKGEPDPSSELHLQNWATFLISGVIYCLLMDYFFPDLRVLLSTDYTEWKPGWIITLWLVFFCKFSLN